MKQRLLGLVFRGGCPGLWCVVFGFVLIGSIAQAAEANSSVKPNMVSSVYSCESAFVEPIFESGKFDHSTLVLKTPVILYDMQNMLSRVHGSQTDYAMAGANVSVNDLQELIGYVYSVAATPRIFEKIARYQASVQHASTELNVSHNLRVALELIKARGEYRGQPDLAFAVSLRALEHLNPQRDFWTGAAWMQLAVRFTLSSQNPHAFSMFLDAAEKAGLGDELRFAPTINGAFAIAMDRVLAGELVAPDDDRMSEILLARVGQGFVASPVCAATVFEAVGLGARAEAYFLKRDRADLAASFDGLNQRMAHRLGAEEYFNAEQMAIKHFDGISKNPWYRPAHRQL